MKTVFNNFQDFENFVGKEIGVTDYFTITQEQINKFAEATIDFQWIHVDVERAKKESPFGNTIAHGYLTLSLLKYFWDQLVEVNNVKSMINYGIETFRFQEPVLVDSNVRVRLYIHSAVNLRGVIKVQNKVRMEIEGKTKPAFEGITTFLFQFNN